MGEAGKERPWGELVAGGVHVSRAKQCWVDVDSAHVPDPSYPVVRVEALVGWGLFFVFWFAGCVGVVVVGCALSCSFVGVAGVGWLG